MRVFHELVYDGLVVSGPFVYIDPVYSELLGSVDVLQVGGYFTPIPGTSPTFFIAQEGSFDRYVWTPQGNIAGGSLFTAQETPFQGIDPISSNPRMPYVRLYTQISDGGGAVIEGMLRLWVTGRDFSRRASRSRFAIPSVRVLSGTAY